MKTSFVLLGPAVLLAGVLAVAIGLWAHGVFQARLNTPWMIGGYSAVEMRQLAE